MIYPTFSLDGEPIPKKNNSRIVINPRTKKPLILPSAAYKAYEASWRAELARYAGDPINYPVNIKCIFYRSTNRRVDLVNLLEAIDDILQVYGIIADDNFKIVAGHDGSRVYVDREHPRTEIFITRLRP